MLQRSTLLATVLTATLGAPVAGQVRPNPGPPLPPVQEFCGGNMVLIRDQSADGQTVVGQSGSGGGGLFVAGGPGFVSEAQLITVVPCDYAFCFCSNEIGAGGQAVSDDGMTVVGTVFRGQRGPVECVATPIVLTPTGLQNLQAVFGDLATTAEGVTGDGQVVVGRSVAMPSGGYVWSAASGAADLAAVIGLGAIDEFWVARNGAVLFVPASDPGTRTVHRWHPSESTRVLGNLPIGEVISRWSRRGEACFSQSLVWTPEETHLLPLDVGWLDVSDDGAVVVGQVPDSVGANGNTVWRRGATPSSFAELVDTLQYRAAANPNPAYDTFRYRVQALRSNEHGVAGEFTVDGYCGWSMVGLDFSVYCRADVNLDGVLNPDDLSDFITGFFSSPPDAVAFWRGQSPPNPDDLSDYITAFFSGCP